MELLVKITLFFTVMNAYALLRIALHLGGKKINFRSPITWGQRPTTPEYEDEDVTSDMQNYMTVDQRVLEREQSMDMRIAKMKDELAKHVPTPHHTLSEATEFHPDVKNLPHDTIIVENSGLQRAEVAE